MLGTLRSVRQLFVKFEFINMMGKFYPVNQRRFFEKNLFFWISQDDRINGY